MEATQELIETIETWNFPKGIENSLTSKLEVPLHLLDIGKENGAVCKLMALINQVEALQGKKLTNEQVCYLISEEQGIIDLIQGINSEQKLIHALDKCRTDRQMIISSTKSNIPIVLDAENIIIVDKEKILTTGSIEHERVLPLLFRITEGGEKIHQEKFRRYGHILKVET